MTREVRNVLEPRRKGNDQAFLNAASSAHIPAGSLWPAMLLAGVMWSFLNTPPLMLNTICRDVSAKLDDVQVKPERWTLSCHRRLSLRSDSQEVGRKSRGLEVADGYHHQTFLPGQINPPASIQGGTQLCYEPITPPSGCAPAG